MACVRFPLSHLGDKLWWADQASEKMGTCNKKDGSEAVVLRNSTTLVMHMKIYDEIIQQQGERGGFLKYWCQAALLGTRGEAEEVGCKEA